jgi:HAD superfamily hydrolase (TIGR01509 family)
MTLQGVVAITFDFGNTLVRVDRAILTEVVARAAERIVADAALPDPDSFVAAWADEQARQFREDVPELREVDLEQRLARVLARFRGMSAPPADVRWDDRAAAALSDPAEVHAGIEAYSMAFVEAIPALPEAGDVLARVHARGYRLGILSNWPSAITIDRFVEAAGWSSYLSAIVVSQRVGTIKPSPRIFSVAAEALAARPSELLHVGDDWVQDVLGAKAAGWRAAYLRDHQGDTPLPTSAPGEGEEADLVLEHLADLEAWLPARAFAAGP